MPKILTKTTQAKSSGASSTNALVSSITWDANDADVPSATERSITPSTAGVTDQTHQQEHVAFNG